MPSLTRAESSPIRTRTLVLRTRLTAANSEAPASLTVAAHGPSAQTSRRIRGIAAMPPSASKSIGSMPTGESRITEAVVAGKRRAYSLATLVP